MGIMGWDGMQYWNRFKVRVIQGRTGEGDGDGMQCMWRSHIDHIVESQDTVGFHHAIHAVGHPVRPLGHAHGIGRGEGIGAIGLPSLITGVAHQYEAEFFDSLHESRDDVLKSAID